MRAPAKTYRALVVWQKARRTVSLIYRITARFPSEEKYSLTSQIRRSAVSIPSNIAEGFERGGDVEFRRFLAIAKGSAGEVKAQLYVALDAGLIDQPAFDSLYEMATETANLIGGFMRYLSRGSAGHGSASHRQYEQSEPSNGQ